MVACPDARPPAYQAAVGFANAGQLDRLVTGYYRKDHRVLESLARAAAPHAWPHIQKRLARRHADGVPSNLVRAHPSFDMALAVENRAPHRLRSRIAQARTERFDRDVSRALAKNHPDQALIFSDVGSEHALPYCREAGIRTILSMVHGDVREEAEVLAREQATSPDFFPMYLADGPIDAKSLAWLHERRLRDLEFADMIAVPSEHIALRLRMHGIAADRIAVIPYAADTRRFVPKQEKAFDSRCRFLFAGGITQRKGIKYLLEAWRKIRRPDWSLGLLGGLPRESAPLEPYRDDVEFLGRVGHSDMPARLASADVFVFPSLFEGSAVVTYEAMACGLPSIVTAESGSVARDGIEGVIVPSANVDVLAASMERLGNDPELREHMSLAARLRSEEFDWFRYHASLVGLVDRAF